MAKELIIEEAKRPMGMHPKKFALWLIIVSIIMMFASLTSAYIVRQAEGNWLLFDLPNIFYLSTFVMLLSSGGMHWSLSLAKKNELEKLKKAITITAVLGGAFLLMQYIGWQDLASQEIFFSGNPSGSFLYVLTGLHGLHLISGIIFLMIVLLATFKFKVHSKSLLTIQMCTTYWHFLDGLWIYLFIFLLLNR